MDYSKRVIASLYLLQVFCTQAMGSCDEFDADSILCQGDDIVNLDTALGEFKKRTRSKKKYNTLHIQGTRIVDIGSISNGEYTNLVFIQNEALKHIHHSSFTSSLKELYILGSSQLKDNIWNVIEKMSALTTLILDNVGLTTVTHFAFHYDGLNKSIRTIRLPNNKIATFCASLKGLKLKKLDLNNNKLNAYSFTNDIFEEAIIETLVLTNNRQLTRLDESQFKGLLDTNNKIQILIGDGADHYVKDRAYMLCKGAEWLCEYKTQVTGYYCSDSKGEDISDYCKSSPINVQVDLATKLETAPNVYAPL